MIAMLSSHQLAGLLLRLPDMPVALIQLAPDTPAGHLVNRAVSVGYTNLMDAPGIIAEAQRTATRRHLATHPLPGAVPARSADCGWGHGQHCPCNV